MFSQAVLQCFVVRLRWLCADGACVSILLSRHEATNSFKFYGQIKPSLWWVYGSAVPLLQLLWLFVLGFEREPHNTVPPRLHMLHILQGKCWACCQCRTTVLCLWCVFGVCGAGNWGNRGGLEWGTASSRVINDPSISWVTTRKGDHLGQLGVCGLKNHKKI